MDLVQQKLTGVRNKLDRYPVLQEIENKTKIRKEYFIAAIVVLVGVSVLYGLGIASLCQIVGFLYPAFKSFQAIETQTKGDDVHWLVYWVIFAFFNILEVFVDWLLYWIPFYYAFKLAFLLWLMLPQTKGASFIYEAFLKDFLKKNESRIDAALNDAKKQASNMATDFSTDAAASATTAGDGVGGDDDNKKDS